MCIKDGLIITLYFWDKEGFCVSSVEFVDFVGSLFMGHIYNNFCGIYALHSILFDSEILSFLVKKS